MCCSHAPSPTGTNGTDVRSARLGRTPSVGFWHSFDTGRWAEEFIGGGGLLIHPDLFARTDSRFFVCVTNSSVAPQRLICSLLFSKCSARIPVDPRDSVKEGAPLRPWPYRVATNACLESMSVVWFPASSETFQ